MDFGRGYGCACGIFGGRNFFAGFGCAGACGFFGSRDRSVFLNTAVAVLFAKTSVLIYFARNNYAHETLVVNLCVDAK